MKGETKMANKKTGHVAIPFLITIIIGLVIVGGLAAGIFNYLGLGQEEELKEPIPRSVGQVTYEDNHTILFIFDEPEKDEPVTFVLMRSRPFKKKIEFIGIPNNSIALVNNEQASIKNNYQSGGAASAKDFVEAVFGVKVDKYMKFNSAAFKKACDILGCVKYPVNADIAGFKNDGTEQDLNSDQIEQFITYELFSGGEAERTVIASDVLRAMINQQKGKNIADNLDISFEAIINMVETDVNAVDYKNRKGAIKYMLENGNTIAGSIALDGKTAGDDFIPSASSIEKIKEQYFTDTE